MEAVHRALVQCLNDRRWADLPRYLHSPLVVVVVGGGGGGGEREVTLDDYAAQLRQQQEQQEEEAGLGRTVMTVDAVTEDAGQQCLASRIIVKQEWDEEGQQLGSGAPVVFTEQNFYWFHDDGRIYKVARMVDTDERQHQKKSRLQSGNGGGGAAGAAMPDLIGDYHEPAEPQSQDDDGDDNDDLHETYLAYLGCINARTMQRDIPGFLLSPPGGHDDPAAAAAAAVVVHHNGRPLTADTYRGLMEGAVAAIPDIHFAARTVVVDRARRRVAVRLEFTGRPVGAIGGAPAPAVAGGGSVRFSEHCTYQFSRGRGGSGSGRGSRIARVWSIVDWPAYRAQISPPPSSSLSAGVAEDA